MHTRSWRKKGRHIKWVHHAAVAAAAAAWVGMRARGLRNAAGPVARSVLTVLTLLVVEGLDSSYQPALLLVAGSVFSLCLPYFSQSKFCGGGEFSLIPPSSAYSTKVPKMMLALYTKARKVIWGPPVCIIFWRFGYDVVMKDNIWHGQNIREKFEKGPVMHYRPVHPLWLTATRDIKQTSTCSNVGGTLVGMCSQVSDLCVTPISHGVIPFNQAATEPCQSSLSI
eukprot:1150370-Pelagomonas_calceolata.AAC.2